MGVPIDIFLDILKCMERNEIEKCQLVNRRLNLIIVKNIQQLPRRLLPRVTVNAEGEIHVLNVRGILVKVEHIYGRKRPQLADCVANELLITSSSNIEKARNFMVGTSASIYFLRTLTPVPRLTSLCSLFKHF